MAPLDETVQATDADVAVATAIVSHLRGYGVKLPSQAHFATQAVARHRIASEAANGPRTAADLLGVINAWLARDCDWGAWEKALDAACNPEPVPATNQAGEVEGRFWLIVHEPGKVPDRKGSWPRSQLPQIMREFIAARPSAYLTVLTVGADGTPDVQHGPEALQMADGRSMRTGRSHNARTLAAHTASLANHPATSQEGEARFLQALERIRDTPDNLVPSVTIQRMRNIAEFALLGEVLP